MDNSGNNEESQQPAADQGQSELIDRVPSVDDAAAEPVAAPAPDVIDSVPGASDAGVDQPAQPAPEVIDSVPGVTQSDTETSQSAATGMQETPGYKIPKVGGPDPRGGAQYENGMPIGTSEAEQPVPGGPEVPKLS